MLNMLGRWLKTNHVMISAQETDEYIDMYRRKRRPGQSNFSDAKYYEINKKEMQYLNHYNPTNTHHYLF